VQIISQYFNHHLLQTNQKHKTLQEPSRISGHHHSHLKSKQHKIIITSTPQISLKQILWVIRFKQWFHHSRIRSLSHSSTNILHLLQANKTSSHLSKEPPSCPSLPQPYSLLSAVTLTSHHRSNKHNNLSSILTIQAAVQEENSHPQTSANKILKYHGKSNSNRETIITITNTINNNNRGRMQLGTLVGFTCSLWT
jgi:hypothetical protein